jgi:glutathione synthase
MQFLFIVDPLERLGLAGDTSYALMLEVEARGHEVWTCLLEDLGLAGDDAVCAASPTEVRDAETPREAFTVGPRVDRRLADFDVFPLEDFRSSDLMDPYRVRHRLLQRKAPPHRWWSGAEV